MKKKTILISLLAVMIVGACAAAALKLLNTDATTSSSVKTSKSVTKTNIANDIVNVWEKSSVDPTKLSIGDDAIVTTGAAVGTLYTCRAGNPNAGGASADGPWINADKTTWDMTKKLAVHGSVNWPNAKYTETFSGTSRIITSNDLPVNNVTGVFPILSSDPSYQYDKNPGSIAEHAVSVTLPTSPVVAATPGCLSEGEVGVASNGVEMFASLDGRGDDAVAHESQDVCNGHPAMTEYHYHNVPSCLQDTAKGTSTVVGWANDGFPITVERDASGNMPSNTDLDVCHGRTSPIVVDGKTVTMYHYSATLEFPYFIGCYKGTPVTTR